MARAAGLSAACGVSLPSEGNWSAGTSGALLSSAAPGLSVRPCACAAPAWPASAPPAACGCLPLRFRMAASCEGRRPWAGMSGIWSPATKVASWPACGLPAPTCSVARGWPLTTVSGSSSPVLMPFGSSMRALVSATRTRKLPSENLLRTWAGRVCPTICERARWKASWRGAATAGAAEAALVALTPRTSRRGGSMAAAPLRRRRRRRPGAVQCRCC